MKPQRVPLVEGRAATLTHRFTAALSRHRERAGLALRADCIPAFAGMTDVGRFEPTGFPPTRAWLAQ